MAPKRDNSNKTFSFDEVAAMLAASNITIGAAHYKVMAKISGSRTESGFEHLFREVKARAKEIRTMMENGEMGDLGTKTPAKRSKSPTGASTGKKTGSGTKKGRKARSEEAAGDDVEESPSKKVKTEDADGAGVDDDDFN